MHQIRFTVLTQTLWLHLRVPTSKRKGGEGWWKEKGAGERKEGGWGSSTIFSLKVAQYRLHICLRPEIFTSYLVHSNMQISRLN